MAPFLTDAERRLCRTLAGDLRAARFRSEPLRARWGITADSAIGRTLRRPAVRELGEATDAAAVLARLLIFGVPQPARQVDAAVPMTGALGLAALGLVRLRGETVEPIAVLRPQSFHDEHGPGEWWIASDLDELANPQQPLPEDYVLGVGGASLTLAGLQLPGASGRVLDLGTGCGVQALRARRSAETVVATDISRRALRFAALTVCLNGIDGIELREGSLFEPVAGEQFDRIVSNPPFVITPRAAAVPAYEYRDGGMVGDALIEGVVRGIGAHLAPGGVAQLLGNWESRDGHDGLDRVREWVESSPVPLEAWVIERDAMDVLPYAELWIRDGGTVPGTPEHDRLLDAWLADFAERGVRQVGFGYLLLRRPTGPVRLRRFERVTEPIAVETGLGAHLAGALAAWDAVSDLDDDALARRALRVAPDVTEARHHLPGAEDPSAIELRQGAGFGRTIAADPALAALVGACDGELSLGAIIAALAELMDAPEPALRSALLPAARDLLLTGMLVH